MVDVQLDGQKCSRGTQKGLEVEKLKNNEGKKGEGEKFC